jgi:hypothetical protein
VESLHEIPEVFAEMAGHTEGLASVIEQMPVEPFAPNMEVQAEMIAREFHEIPALQYENWVELGADERVAALQQLENRIAVIEMRDPLTIRTEAMDAAGYCNYSERLISINTDRLMTSSRELYLDNLDTLFHEGRHAYQHYNLDKLVRGWYINLKDLHYDNGERLFMQRQGFCAYLAQPVEYDARVFAEKCVQVLGI